MKTSLFNLTHERRATGNMGYLTPVLCELVAPGTIWRQNSSVLMRTQPLLYPVMDKVDISIHHWAVPLRLLMDDFEDFITGGQDGLQAPALPTITINDGSGFAVGSLADHLGIPTGQDDIEVSAFPFRAYAEIYNNWYRDEQLMPSVAVSKANGADTTTNLDLLKAAWGKDYFTSARPSPQLGSAVAIPLTGDAPVISNPAPTGPALVRVANNGNLFGSIGLASTATGQLRDATDTALGYFDPNGTLSADLSDVSAVSVDELREASAIQRFKEKMNRYGSRYTEYLRSVFRVRPQDMRLQLPEYIGGGRSTIQFSEVLQTSATGEDGTPLATLGGHGIAAGRSNRFKYFATEHCIIMTLMCVRPKTSYSQGIRRWMMYQTKYDFLIPDFAHLGDQEIYTGEVFARGASLDRDAWAFAPKYDEYRYIPNSIAGEFKTTMNYVTYSRLFSSFPALNAAFVTADPTDRVYATTTEDELQYRVIHNIKAKLPLPKVATPRLY